MTDEDFDPVIRTQQDVTDMWRTLMNPLGFSRSSVWLLLIGADDRPLKTLTEIADADELPTETERAGLAAVLRQVRDDVDPAGRWAFLRTRPGRRAVTDADRDVARVLYEAGRAAGVPVEVVHLATDTDIVPIPLDEIGVLAS